MARSSSKAIDSIVYFLEDASALGGVRKHVIDSAREMTRRGFKVSIVSRYYSADILLEGAPTEFIYEPGYQELVRSPKNTGSDEAIFSARIRANTKINQFFGGLTSSTVVIAVQYGCLVDLEHANFLRKADRQFHLIGAYHSSWNYAKEAGYLRLLERLLQACDRAVFLTSEDLSKFEADGITNGMSIPNAIENHLGPPSANRDAACVYVGRLHAEKGVEELVNVWADAIASNQGYPALKIYGTGPLEGRLKQLVSTKGLSEWVELCGFTSRPQDILSQHRMVVSCSPREGFPMMLLEAGSVGTPCVVYDAGPGTREFASSRGAGFVIPKGDRTRFMEAVADLSKDDELWKDRSKAALNAASDYSPDKIYTQWEQLIAVLSGAYDIVPTPRVSTPPSQEEPTEDEMSEPNTHPNHIAKYVIPTAVDFSSSSLIFSFSTRVNLKDYVAAFRYWDERGEPLRDKVDALNYSDFLQAPFAYVPDSDVYGPDNPMLLPLEVPPGAARMEVQLHQWGKQSDPRKAVTVFLKQKTTSGTVSFKLPESE
ncbi:glycosyltransferase [Corynebacterium sp. NML180780]|uniref:glycosyltransferase n=1 Tax=Corynebacterium sp. NML180780 TaxID=2598459 RepID=UPI00119585E2|nr:glycosyltransferase [Corynebacterium sp. NML180780]TVX76184.1 glycosyltransferase family 4 protein [Corynebacterium sp. NML180780]